MNQVRHPWPLFLALVLILSRPIAVVVVGGIGGAVLRVLAWGLAVAAFAVVVRGHRRSPRSRAPSPGSSRSG